MKTRDEIDQIAWDTIHKMGLRNYPPPGLTRSNRPSNYAELAELASRKDFELAWSEFLHEFYRYKSAVFFAVPPPETFRREYRALLAGTAEFLSTEFNLPVPEWVDEPGFTLPELWDPWEDICPDMIETREYRLGRTPQAFLKRNLIFEARNLISL